MTKPGGSGNAGGEGNGSDPNGEVVVEYDVENGTDPVTI